MTTTRPTRSLAIGSIELASPVILAPMAGITNSPFRVLCRQLEQQYVGTVSGLYICEMITARALVERTPKTMTMIKFAECETPRSLQLYTVDPDTTSRAVRMIVEENLADHIDLNFGCPVPKVTRKGGGSALPYKRRLFEKIVTNAVKASENTVPVTVKMRKGIDNEHLTYLDAGKIAENAGVQAVTLHGRTAAELYSGTADWDAIATLKNTVTSIPVLGNGDVYTVEDVSAMMNHTRCDGVVIGRGCLGKPWFFAEIAHAMLHHTPMPVLRLHRVGEIMYHHAELLCEHMGEHYGIRDMRKHTNWYLRGFPVGGQTRAEFSLIESLAHLRRLIDDLPDSEFPVDGHTQRGRKGNPQKKVHLPDGWLTDPEDIAVPHAADIDNSGG